jgi:small subunit ribosomal protein S17
MSEIKTQKAESLKLITGLVVSNKMDKTVTVKVETSKKHPLYGKFVKHTTTYHVHDDKNVCNEGDTVTITQCRPLSKTKFWRLVEVLKKAQ